MFLAYPFTVSLVLSRRTSSMWWSNGRTRLAIVKPYRVTDRKKPYHTVTIPTNDPKHVVCSYRLYKAMFNGRKIIACIIEVEGDTADPYPKDFGRILSKCEEDKMKMVEVLCTDLVFYAI